MIKRHLYIAWIVAIVLAVVSFDVLLWTHNARGELVSRTYNTAGAQPHEAGDPIFLSGFCKAHSESEKQMREIIAKNDMDAYVRLVSDEKSDCYDMSLFGYAPVLAFFLRVESTVCLGGVMKVHLEYAKLQNEEEVFTWLKTGEPCDREI